MKLPLEKAGDEEFRTKTEVMALIAEHLAKQQAEMDKAINKSGRSWPYLSQPVV